MRQTLLIGIGGGTGAGKSTLVTALQERIGADHVSILRTDAFFRPGTTTNNRPESIDEEQLRTAVYALRQGEPAHVPARGQRPAYNVEPRRINLVEGHLCLTFTWLAEMVDLSIYVDMDDEERVLRRVERNVNQHGLDLGNVISWYRQDVLHNHRAFTAPTKTVADLILWGEWSERRLSRIVQIIKSLAHLDA
jgi:uridine kinase